MASGYKSHKTELIAIYRLEFYKKQKNWKFAHESKKPAKTPRSKYTKIRKRLNETYDVEPQALNVSSPLNEGFLDEVPEHLGKDLEVSPQPASANTLCDEPVYQPWSQEYYEPERDNQQWWDEQHAYTEPYQVPQDYVEAWAGDNGTSPYDCVDAPRGWSQDIQMDELVSAIERCGIASDHTGQYIEPQDHPPCVQADESDSFTEFVRGAHLAPHSSETDLQIDTSAACACPAGPAALLSSRALSVGVRTHAAALAALLRETARRDRDRHKLSRTCCSELLSPPLSDRLQSSHLSRQDTFTVSCTNIGEGTIGPVGRGRGRLQRDHIIGIGMGRPYRLA